MLIFDQLKRNDPQLRLLTLVMLAGMCLLLAGLWWVQIVSSRDYQANLETQSIRTVRIPAMRGKILDRNGVSLAENQPSYNVSLYLEEFRDQFQGEFNRLRPRQVVTNSGPFWKRWFDSGVVKTQYARLSKDQKAALAWRARYTVASNVVQQISRQLQQPLACDFTNFARHYAKSLVLPFPVARNLSPAQVARFEEQFINPVGVDLEIQSCRVYPQQTTAAHLLGHLHYDDRSIEGEDAFFSYRLADYSGVLGIESGYEKELHGSAGVKSVLVNNLGYRQTENVSSPADPGRNVVLTIDLNIQQAAEQALSEVPVADKHPRGAVVVMDVETGDVLALASSPAYDPNAYIPRLSREDDLRLSDPKLRPQINRATQENYAPGSIFKPIVGLACLEAGMNPNAQVEVKPNPQDPAHGMYFLGRRGIRDTVQPGMYDFRRALMFSSNSYFITNGLKVGIESIVKLGQRLHFGERIGLPTRQETAGVFPSLEKVRSGWSDGDTANLCIGQGYIDVTPLQMAVMTAALANGGKVLWPRLVDRIESQDPTDDEPPTVFPKGRVRDNLGVKPRNLQILRDAMRDEVEDAGTGSRAVVPGLKICGKTGTAQIANERNQIIDHTTWFISFAPYERPRWAVVVMVQSGASGATTCAPLAQKIYTALLENGRLNALPNKSLAQAN